MVLMDLVIDQIELESHERGAINERTSASFPPARSTSRPLTGRSHDTAR